MFDARLVQRYAGRHSGFLLLSHGRLLWRVTRTELASRYAGSLLGIGWSLLGPLLILTLYAVTYTLILQVKVPGLEPWDYTLFIFAGLVPFLATAEALNGTVSSVVANKAVLSNTVFPIDLAPVKGALLSQCTMAVGMAATILGVALNGRASPTLALLPLVWALHLLALIGIGWVLALLHVVLRDLQTVVAVGAMMLMIASPIAYTPEMVPQELRFLLAANPFAYYVVAYQKVLILGQVPSAGELLAMAGFSGAAFAVGGYFFARSKKVLIDYV
jgi:lipopolysaccharide transport system permease protein